MEQKTQDYNNIELQKQPETNDKNCKLATSNNAQQDQTNEPIKLERRFGLASAVLMIVAVIVGSGIFVSPRQVLKQTGSISLALVIWALCGLLSLLGALCLAELGTAFPSSGGDYTYINMAFGPVVSFLYLWTTVLIILPCSNAIAALTFSNYFLQPFYSGCPPPDAPVQMMALAIIMLLVYVNCRNVSASIKLQDSFTLTKVFALTLIIIYGFYNIAFNSAKDKLRQRPLNEDSQTNIAILAGAFYSSFYSYAGWNSLNFVTEEIKEPVKNLPRAIVIALTLVTSIYILANISYFSVLDKNEIFSSSAIAVEFGKRAFGSFSWIMPVLVGLSAVSGLNALIYSSSRILFVGARRGQLMSLLNMININTKSPVPSLILVGIMSVAYLSSTNINALISYLTFAEAGFGTLAVSTVLVLRRKYPNTKRPVKVNILIPLVYLTLAAAMLVLPIFDSPFDAIIGFVIILAGWPVYHLTANWTQKPAAYQAKINALNIFTQKLTLSVQPTENDELQSS